MDKDYQKPDFEFVPLIIEDRITDNDDSADGEIGLESSIFPV